MRGISKQFPSLFIDYIFDRDLADGKVMIHSQAFISFENLF